MTKKRDIEKMLREYGWWADGGTKHDHWTNGVQKTTLPRHKEINENTARGILQMAKANPGPFGKQKVKKKK